jgi:small conductance mechanosensitive channel
MRTIRGSRRWSGRVAAFLLLVMVVFPVAGQAQEAESDAALEAIETATDQNVGQRAAEIMDRLDQAVQVNRGYKAQLAASSPEDSLVLRLQIENNSDRFMEGMSDLAGALLQDEEGQDQVELMNRGKAIYVAVTPLIWELIGELRTEIDNNRAQRTEISPSERVALEERLTLLTQRLDAYYSYGFTHIEKMDSFGLESPAEKDTLSVLLSERANEISGRLDLASLRIRGLNNRLKNQAGDTDLTLLLVSSRKDLETNISSQTVTLDLMDEIGLQTERYRTQLVTLTQDLASGLLDVKVAARLTRQAWDSIRSWTANNGPSFLVKVLLFLVIVIGGRFLANLVSRIVEKSLNRANLNMSYLLKRMTVTFSRNAVNILALVFGLAQLGFSLGPLLAGFGVVGFILGFAMQDSLSNLAAGMMILINRPYDVGDLVEISAVFGKVEQMSMVSTSVLTLDNQKLVVPNSKIWGDVIKNVTDQRIRRVDMTFGISYTDDIPHAEEVLNDILNSHEKVLSDPEPMVRLHTLNESSVDFVVRPWVKTDDYWDIYWDVTRAVKMRFDEEGISIPFPQRDVHFYEQKRLPAGGDQASGGVLEQPPVPQTGQDGPGDD